MSARESQVVKDAGAQVKADTAPSEIGDRKRLQALLSAQRRSLQLIAGGARLTEVLQDLCDTIDAQAPEIISTVLLMDPDGEKLRPAVGRRVPEGWSQIITPLPIGPQMGSCGTAAFLKKPVITSDIASDPLWRDVEGIDYRNLALGYGLGAAWSYPLISKDEELLGTFAIYYPEPKRPGYSDLELIETAANIAVIAIESDRSRASLEKAFDEIKNSEAKLRQVIDTIPALAWCNLPDGPNEFLNKRWHDYTGFSPEESHGWGWQAAFHPDDLPALMERWREMLVSGEPSEIEARLRRYDGVFRWFLIRAEPLRDETGKIIRWYGTSTDIEERKRAEEQLRREETELRQITDAIAQSIMVLAPDGTALYANRSALEYSALTMEAVAAPDFRARFFHPEDVERLRDERQLALARGAPFENEQRARRKDGEYRWFLVQYRPVKDEDGQILRWYATGTDIHDRKQAGERMHSENLALREEIDRTSMFEEIVGSSEPLRAVLRQVARVAPVDSTVLILGETGTGKELIARAIHKKSSRASRAFIRVNCSAIPPSLLASELFGHEKGAFTGATHRRLGRFESADGGTIFLDEIGDLPSETQIALLRVLQEKEFERLGNSRPISVDVRVVAATNRDLGAAVAAGSFREDLFYRFNVFPIEVPSLRERPDDIPLLVEYFIQRYAKQAGKRIKTITKESLDQFKGYAWPGNIRELQNVIERAVILCDGETFSVDQTWFKRQPSRESHLVAESDRGLGRDPEHERALIESALADTRGRISGPSGAATRLGIPRQTLESKIRSLGIDKHRFRRA
jgi:formate hydrogenlyase transcriptional activator